MRIVVREPGDPLFSTVIPVTATIQRWSTLVEVCRDRPVTSTVATAPVMLGPLFVSYSP